MARPLRIEFSGALYHVTSRGDRQEAIFLRDGDRLAWLDALGAMCERFNIVVHGFCQMTNHYHVIVETPDANLSRGMRQLNGAYTQRFNRQHGVAGHLFQGRYHAVLIDKHSHLLELARYVVLNPVRAGLAPSAQQWPWSSYRYVDDALAAPAWLDTEWTLGQFGAPRAIALQRYRQFVAAGMGQPNPLENLRHQLLLGAAAIDGAQARPAALLESREISRTQRRSLALPLEAYRSHYPQRDEAMAQAYQSGAYSMAQIGQYFGVNYMTVSRAVRRAEAASRNDPPAT